MNLVVYFLGVTQLRWSLAVFPPPPLFFAPALVLVLCLSFSDLSVRGLLSCVVC